MSFPTTPLPVMIELYTGSWTDITSDVRSVEGPIVLRRGQADEAQAPEPGSIDLSLRNVKYLSDGVTVQWQGKYSPRNPSSDLYGTIGRNTPIRVRILDGVAGDPYLLLGSHSSQAVTEDHSSLDIVGDIDMRIDVLGIEIPTSNGATLAAKFSSIGNQRSYAFLLNTDGTLTIQWSTDGTSGGVLSATSTVTAGLVSGERKAMRVTLDVNNGAAGRTAIFYTADTIAGPWVQLGATVTSAGTTSVFASTSSLQVGFGEAFSSRVDYLTRIYGFELRNGIAGSVVANPDFTAQTSDTTSFVDGAGRTWTLDLPVGSSISVAPRIADPGQRGIGEISEWPPRWDLSGRDSWVPVTAQGLLRRLGQGDRLIRSPIKSEIMTTSSELVHAYWPMEDLGGEFGSGLPGGSAMTRTGDAPEFAGLGPILGSDKVAILAATTALSGDVPAFTPSLAQFSVSFLADFPDQATLSPAWSDNAVILRVPQSTSGSSVGIWEVRYKSGGGGDLEVRALSTTGTQLDTTGTINLNVDAGTFRVDLVLSDSGSDTSVQLLLSYVDDDGVVQQISGSDTFTGLVRTYPTEIQVAPFGGLQELAVGHVLVADQSPSSDPLISYAGEYADRRASRLIGEVGADYRIVGTPQDGAAMGPQATPATFADGVAETYEADIGLLFEARDTLGLTFRTRRSLYNQDVALTLDYTGSGEIAPGLDPTDDDQRVRNRVEAKRTNGSSAVYEDSASRMGTQPPPDGVGSYEDSVELNLLDDSTLMNQASWRVHLGTCDEARYPTVHVNLAAAAAAGRFDLVAAAAGLDVGDRLQLINLPVQAGADGGAVDLMVLGFQETITYPNGWDAVFNCVPYRPWVVGVYADTSETPGPVEAKRRSPRESLVDSTFIAGTNTSLVVEDQQGGTDLWSTTADFPFDIRVAPVGMTTGGVRLRVSAISAPTGAKQTMTVSATVVNGVNRTIPAGWQVTLWQPAVYAL